MTLPQNIKEEVQEKLALYLGQRAHIYIRPEVRFGFTIRGSFVTLYEERPYINDPNQLMHTAVAQFRFDVKTAHWTLYYADHNVRWHGYIGLRSSKSINNLLREIDRDPKGIFW